MKHHAEIGVLAKRTWLGIDLNSLDARATEVISTAAAYVRLFENEEAYGTLEVLWWRFDEGVIVATCVHLEGLASAKKTYEISKSLDFEWDFMISELISRFQSKFDLDIYSPLQATRIYNR